MARYSTAERRVNVGDRVSFVDAEKCQPYQIIIVLGERNNPNDGLVSLYSYLGASIFGLREQECFKLYILGKEREYKVVNILPEKSLTCVN
ncbi:MAG: GreA/GreB family elongation factor [Vibrio anguillarum]